MIVGMLAQLLKEIRVNKTSLSIHIQWIMVHQQFRSCIIFLAETETISEKHCMILTHDLRQHSFIKSNSPILIARSLKTT